MHPTTLFLSFVALASVAISTKNKDNGPRCPEDEYYNKMMESKNRKTAVSDCAKWLGTTITEPKEIPKYLKDCGGDKDEDRVSRVSAACSCVETSSVSLTLSTSTHVSTIPSSTAIVTTSLSSVSSTVSTSHISSTSRLHPTPSSSRHPSTTTSNHEVSSVASSTPLSSHSTSSYTSTHNSVSSSTKSSTASASTQRTTSTSQSILSSSSGITTKTFTANTQTLSPTTQSTVTASHSTVTSVVPSQASTTSLTTSTIYTKSIYTITSCAPDKPDCPAASTVLVTSTIAISTTVCPVTETPRPTPSSKKTTTQWTTATIYSTSTYTLTRCPAGATNCLVSNLPITTRISVSTTVSSKKEETPTQPSVSNGSHEKPDVASTTFTVVTVPTTIHTIMNGVSAQILTVVPVTSALGVGNSAEPAQTPSSTAEADPHAVNAEALPTGSGTHPHAAPTHASFDAIAWQSSEPSRSGLTWKPVKPAENATATTSASSRPPVVTAGAPGLMGSDGMRVAFLVFALAALL